MKSYEIWLKGGGSLNGAMKDEDAVELRNQIKQQRGVFIFTDGDNDEVCLLIDQVAVFAFRDDQVSETQIGFEIK